MIKDEQGKEYKIVVTTPAGRKKYLEIFKKAKRPFKRYSRNQTTRGITLISWNAQKKEMRGMDTKELMEKLQQLETEKVRMEMKSRGFGGDRGIPMSQRRMSNTKESHIDLKGLMHKIASIKTILYVKLSQLAQKG